MNLETQITDLEWALRNLAPDWLQRDGAHGGSNQESSRWEDPNHENILPLIHLLMIDRLIDHVFTRFLRLVKSMMRALRVFFLFNRCTNILSIEINLCYPWCWLYFHFNVNVTSSLIKNDMLRVATVVLVRSGLYDRMFTALVIGHVFTLYPTIH